MSAPVDPDAGIVDRPHPSEAASIPVVAPVVFEPPTCEWDPDLPAPSFYNHAETFPFLARALLPHFDAIMEEMKAATRWVDWPERNLYSAAKGHDWKVLPFVYTIPSYDPSRTVWVEETVASCPRTCAVLQAIPGLRTALFSRLGPHTTLGTHQGWADLSNHVLRCHLPFIVPLAYTSADDDGSVDSRSEVESEFAAADVPVAEVVVAGSRIDAAALAATCGIVVDGVTQHHRERQLIVFDDSKKHYAFNNHPTHSRVVLIFDIARPELLPRGLATGATTKELMAFIDYFK